MTDTRKNLYVSAVVLALVLLFLFGTTALSPEGRLVPQVVGLIGLVLAVLDVIAHTDTAPGRRIAKILSGSAHRDELADQPRLSLEVVACAWTAAAAAVILVFGFMLAVPVYVFAYMMLKGGKTVRESALAAAGTTLFVWVVFEILMEYEVYRGLLFSEL